MKLKRVIKNVKLEKVELKNVELDVLDTDKPKTDYSFEQQLKKYREQSKSVLSDYKNKEYAGKNNRKRTSKLAKEMSRKKNKTT